MTLFSEEEHSLFPTYSKGRKRTGAAETTATRVEEQVDGETGHKATRQTQVEQGAEAEEQLSQQRTVTQ